MKNVNPIVAQPGAPDVERRARRGAEVYRAEMFLMAAERGQEQPPPSGRLLVEINPAWLRLAQILPPTLDIATYIRRRLVAHPEHQRLPYPKELATVDAVEKFDEDGRILREELALDLQIQQQAAVRELRMTMADGLDDAMARRLVVLSPDLEWSPLFRLCLAGRLGLLAEASMMNLLLPGAVPPYARIPDLYQRVWQDWLPPVFTAAAPRIHARLCGLEK